MYFRYKFYLLKLLPVWVIALFIVGCSSGKKEIEYSTGEWEVDTLGYHRVVIENRFDADAVFVEVPWRRRDSEPWNKAIILISEELDQVVTNVFCVSSNNEKGQFVFQPVTGAGKYFLYYLPGRMKGRSNYPTVNYPSAVQTADNAWIELHNLRDRESFNSLPEAKVTTIQSRNELIHSIQWRLLLPQKR